MSNDHRITHSALKVTAVALAVHCALTAGVARAQENGTGEDEPLEEVFVLGRGETRQVQSVGAQQMELLPAGTSPLKAIEKLPGVNFQSADPYGAYEWSTRITVRGFNQNRLGFTLDGVPLGDMTYGNHNGLHVSRAIAPELIERVSLSQGAGALTTASTSNLGGAVEFVSADPSAQSGFTVAQLLGSDSARRTFAKFESGELGTGTRLYVTGVDASTDKWKGGGDQQQRMYTLKVVQELGEARLTAYYDYSDRAEIDYQDLSKDIVARRGPDWDNWFPNWSAAVAAAQACNDPAQSNGIVCDDAYWNASGLRQDDLGYLALDLPLGETWQLRTTAYLHKDEGQGLWGTPYVPTPGGAPLSIRTTEYDLDRRGLIASLTWHGRAHEISGGAWYETNDFTQARRFYAEPSIDAPTRSFEEMQRNPFRTDWEYDFETETVTFYLQDRWSLSEAVRLDLGFRSVNVENRATTIVGEVKSGTIETDEPFLPQVGINWRLNEELEAFAAVARNVRAFASSGTSGPFSTNAAAFNAIRDTLEPETSTNYEAGVRFRGKSLDGVLTAYHVDFDDRLLGIPQCLGIVGCAGALANVGSVRTNGIEAALAWRALDHVSWFSSLAWNDSEFADDYTITDAQGTRTVVPVSGKQVPDAPEILFKSELSYDNGSLFAHVDVNYTDERFYTYLNEGGVDAYTLLNVGVGYRFTGLPAVEELLLQADVTNVTDKEYFSTIDSNGFVNSDLDNNEQTLLLGAPRQFFVSLKARF